MDSLWGLRGAEQTLQLSSAPSRALGSPVATRPHSVVCPHHLFVCRVCTSTSSGWLWLCVTESGIGEGGLQWTVGPLDSRTQLPNACDVYGRLAACRVPCHPLPAGSRFIPSWSCDLGALFVVQTGHRGGKKKVFGDLPMVA